MKVVEVMKKSQKSIYRYNLSWVVVGREHSQPHQRQHHCMLSPSYECLYCRRTEGKLNLPCPNFKGQKVQE